MVRRLQTASGKPQNCQNCSQNCAKLLTTAAPHPKGKRGRKRKGRVTKARVVPRRCVCLTAPAGVARFARSRKPPNRHGVVVLPLRLPFQASARQSRKEKMSDVRNKLSMLQQKLYLGPLNTTRVPWGCTMQKLFRMPTDGAKPPPPPLHYTTHPGWFAVWRQERGRESKRAREGE